MSFDTLRKKRRVNIVNTTRTGEDDYGNQITTELDPVEVWATRQQLTATEDIVDRDQQARTYRYFFRPSVIIDGRSLLIDGDEKLKIIGEPEVISTAIGPHHIEAIAELTEG